MLVSTQLIAVLVLSISFPTPSVATAAAAHWHKDEAFEAESADVLCDFPVFDPKKDSFEEFAEAPFIIADDALSASWPAHRRWQKDNFIHSYGNRMINYDSHSSIVYGGGEAGIPITLRDLLAAMDVMYERNSTITTSSPSTHSSDAAAAATTTTECEVEDGSCSSGSNDSETAAGWAVESDAFVFDTTIMRAIPELRHDITVPSIFANWHNQQTEERGNVWSMLSLGPSRSGLPFHSHGQTWLAVVHGAKRWFVYPPGFTPPLPLMQSFNPMLPSQRWFSDIYPLLTDATTGYPKPLSGIAANQQHSTVAATMAAYRPLECVQRAGQVVFLPSRWSHMTMNIGETVAFGGQAGLGAETRLAAAEKVLDWNPHDFEALKDVGLGRIHLVNELIEKVRSLVNPAAPLFRTQQEQQLVYLIQHTEDPFVVLLLNINHWKTSPQQVQQRIVSAWQQLALQLIDTANVAVVAIRELRSGAKSEDFATGNFLFDPAMSVVVYHGANKKLNSNSNSKSNGASSVLLYDAEHYGTDCSEELLEDYRQLVAAEKLSLEEARQRYFSDVDGLAQCVHNVMQRHNITSGSMAGKHGMTASQRGFEQSINHLKRAIEVKPLHPEVRCMLAQVQGIQRDFAAMKVTIESAKTVFDAMHESQQLSKQSRAALYHKLATTYLSVDLHLESLPYMEMSLDVLPSYVPALVDRVMAHVLHLQQKMRAAKEKGQALQYKLQSLQHVEVRRRSTGDEAGAAAVAAEREALISTAASSQTPTDAATSYSVVSPEEINSLLAALQQLQAVAPKHPSMSWLQSAMHEIEQA